MMAKYAIYIICISIYDTCMIAFGLQLNLELVVWANANRLHWEVCKIMFTSRSMQETEQKSLKSSFKVLLKWL